MREPTASTGTELARDVLRSERQPPLEPIFAPRTVAVIGASEDAGSVGRTLLWNLLNNPFGGTVYPVNRERASVVGVEAYPNVAAVPEPVDLAVIATPAAGVPNVISECVEAGVRGAIVLSAGFREVGEAGAELERRIIERARRGRLRLVGPNCLGVMRPTTGLNATLARAMAPAGRVAFISQSGALGAAVLDRSVRENVGFSSFISVGSMLDVGWGDLIYYLRDDVHTRSILIYMETIGDARSFISAAREVALIKPIIVLKVGHTEAAAKAAATHTGALTGSDEVLDAALRRCGVLRVDDIEDLFEMAEVLAKQPRPKGPRLTIVTNAGGPGVLATDALISGGGELAKLSEETMESLNGFLPAPWSHANPVDILGDADPERYAKTIEAVSDDKGSDGLLFVLTPQAVTDPTAAAEVLTPYAKLAPFSKKRRAVPILASWMGGGSVAVGEEILNGAGIPTFDYPDTAARVFNYMWRYAYNLRSIYETPEIAEEEGLDDERAGEIISSALEEKRTLLTDGEAKEVFTTYAVPIVETRIAHNEEEAVRHADDLGYPAVLKLYSKTITHKTDVGGVELHLENANAVREAYSRVEKSVREKAGVGHFQGVTVQPMISSTEGYELIVGSSVDPQFGPVMLFGSGGRLVEAYEDRALALPPLNTTLARRMMEETRVYEALKGVRGRPSMDLGTLEKLLVRFSRLVVEQPWIKEIDINPLLVSPEGLVALDARIVLHNPGTEEGDLPKPAIRPYPKEYVSRATLKNGTTVTIRPVRPEDEPLMVGFHESLSERSVYMRYFRAQRLSTRISHENLRRVCFVDYDREVALVAEHKNPKTGEPRIAGIGHLGRDRVVAKEAELTLLVSDEFQHRGLGSALLGGIIEAGRAEDLHRITAVILYRNRPMRRLAKKFGFRVHRDPEGGPFEAELDL